MENPNSQNAQAEQHFGKEMVCCNVLQAPDDMLKNSFHCSFANSFASLIIYVIYFSNCLDDSPVHQPSKVR